MAENFSARGRLDSWKEIADYLKRDTRTAIRWEQERGMPVHRVPGGKRQAVFAFTDEIDAWLLSQEAQPSSETAQGAPVVKKGKEKRRARANLGVGVVIGACLVAGLGIAGFFLARSRRSTAIDGLDQRTHDGYQKEGLFTDGTTLYFGERVGAKLVIASAPANGGPVHRIETPFSNVMLEDLSNDGTRLLIRSMEGISHSGRLWVLHLSGGPPIPVGEGTCTAARWSPDNQKVACARGTTIFVMDADGSHERELGRFSLPVGGLIWTPDGLRLRFVMRDVRTQTSSQWEIQVNQDGDAVQPQRLLLSPTCCSAWTWTRDGKTFLYEDLDAQGNGRLMMRPENDLLTATVASEIPVKIGALRGIAAGKDNKLYLAIDKGSNGELQKFDLKHDEPVAFRPGLSATFLAFSRDSQWISYVTTDDLSLWRSRVDGSEVLRLTTPPMDVEIPAWSPDGRRIAFMGHAPGKSARIYVVDRDGGAPKEVAEGNDNQGGPSWSPDGKKIVYGNTYSEETTQDGWVRLIDLATRQAKIVPGSRNFRTARWSFDGKYIAALDWQARKLMLLDVHTMRWKPLADSILGDNLSWSSNSESVFVDSLKDGKPVVEQIRIRDGRRVAVASLEALQKVPGEFNWFGLTHDDLPIVLHVRSSGDIYSLEWEGR
jgi:Tol biopolymer transport system component